MRMAAFVTPMLSCQLAMPISGLSSPGPVIEGISKSLFEIWEDASPCLGGYYALLAGCAKPLGKMLHALQQ